MTRGVEEQRSRVGRRASARAFTLLELLAVMVVIGALGVLALPRLSGSRARGRVADQARATVALARAARARAAAEGRVHHLQVDPVARTIGLVRRRDPLAAPSDANQPEVEAIDADTAWSRPQPLQDDVTLVELTVPWSPLPSTETASAPPVQATATEPLRIAFRPQGDADGARLVFEGPQGDRFAVEVDGPSGAARIVEDAP